MSHDESLNHNIESFKKDALIYDSIPAMQVLSNLFTLSMLQFPSSEKSDHVVLTAEDIEAQLHAAHTKFKYLDSLNADSVNVDSVNADSVNADSINTGSINAASINTGSINADSLQLHNSISLGTLLQKNSTVVDFACGTGLVASKIAPYISEGRIIGVDISEAMLDEFDAKAKQIRHNFPALDVSSVCGDVLSSQFDMAPLTGIADILVCSLAFHHLHDYKKVADKMKQMLKPGGWILVYDFYNEDQEKPLSDKHIQSGVSHHGLTLDEMRDALAEGCKNVTSSREYRVDVWHELPFIESHCCEDVRANLDAAQRKGDFYLVSTSIILGAAQKC